MVMVRNIAGDKMSDGMSDARRESEEWEQAKKSKSVEYWKEIRRRLRVASGVVFDVSIDVDEEEDELLDEIDQACKGIVRVIATINRRIVETR